MIPAHWIAHRRTDGEAIGWIDMDTASPLLIPVDRLGRQLPAVREWDQAEAVLEKLGIGFLGDYFRWNNGHTSIRVRIVEVNDTRIVVSPALTDAVGDPAQSFEIPFPAPAGLTADT